LVALQDIPPGLAQDEILDADIAAFIRQGQHALFFREGYGHEPLFHYLAAPFQPLLGDNYLSIRLPAAFLGLLLVAATMRWARREFGPAAGLVAGAGLAVSWWPIIFSRIGLRPILEPLLLVLAAWFWPRRPLWAGLFLGLSVYSYTAARVVFLIPLGLAAQALVAEKDRAGRIGRAQSAVIVLALTLLVTLPMYLTLRADPTLQQRVDQLSEPLEALRQGDWRPVLEASVATLGVCCLTGDPRWTYSLPGRPLFDPLTALLFLAGLILAIRRARRPAYGPALIWLAATLLPSAITPQAPSTVRLVGAMPVVYLMPGLAAQWLLQAAGRTTARIRQIALPVSLLALLFLNLGRTIWDGFIAWPAAVETHFNYQTVFLEIARHRQTQPEGTPVIAESFFEPIDHDSVRRNLGREIAARWVQGGGAIIFPAGGDGRFYVPEYAPPAVELAAAAGLTSTPFYQSEGRPSFAVYALPPAPQVPSMASPVTFDGAITLLGYELLLPQDGQPLRLVTHWQVASALPWDLAIFVHLLATDGTIISQHDGLDAAPATLRPGDAFIQYHVLRLPEEQPGQPLTLQLGLYTRGDGRRLTHAGRPADRLILAEELVFDER
ncbi:MAG: glycosyltransferase family 39 protein, partial [Chloroflexi bacterium]|nr:glycosyltransferase family 39 protein [Chloroflexota bacterium]